MVNLFIESIPPLYLCCDTLITAADVASASRFQNECRRNEHLAWRRIVRRELGRDIVIEYNEVGAPVVDAAERYISVSHCRDMVAVAISDRAVGVDIEYMGRNFSGVQTRYMTSQEILLTCDSRWAAMAWTAKEALYKLYGMRGVELRGDITITLLDIEAQYAEALLGGVRRAIVEFKFTENNTVCAVATYKEE